LRGLRSLRICSNQGQYPNSISERHSPLLEKLRLRAGFFRACAWRGDGCPDPQPPANGFPKRMPPPGGLIIKHKILCNRVETQTESTLISSAQGIPQVASCRMCPICWGLPILKACISTCHPEIAMQSRNLRNCPTARKSRGLCSSPKIVAPFLEVFRKVKDFQRKFPFHMARFIL
jgi:hypothetical protein